jgi:hypothetical protein
MFKYQKWRYVQAPSALVIPGDLPKIPTLPTATREYLIRNQLIVVPTKQKEEMMRYGKREEENKPNEKMNH